ncbi:hypothetical protein DPMN_014180 [Dreissena polymorpha]|uniref:Uncharacterized protein n=1 Tax=Dreissena polymorpha TaxID=45954 RepID=A0A9D4NAA0_DREPO|nr:hypothetical protein DPMN_014180 [Dreissena polymorpha]
MKSEHPGGHVFQQIGTIFFHEDSTLNAHFKSVNKKNEPPPGGHVFQPTRTFFELGQDIIGTNLLTKFHEDRTINVASRIKINDLFFAAQDINKTNVLTNIFELVQDIIGTNHLTKFHEDLTINVASRVLTRQIFMTHNGRKTIDKTKNAPPPGEHVFQPIQTIFELVQDIIRMNLLTKFQDDRTINVASRVLTRKNAPPPGGHVFQATGSNFKHFHHDRTINVASKV